ncbi:MAG: propionyl-CoA carboxylase, partial [Chloroflexi bacterium]|nr:propionyl-CoA carboxylase [Chloroflexota bacterium]
SAEWGGIPIEGGVEAAYRRELEAIEEPERRAARRAELERELVSLRSPFRTAEAFQIEEIIDPRDTRPLLIEHLEASLPAARRHLGPKPRFGVLP